MLQKDLRLVTMVAQVKRRGKTMYMGMGHWRHTSSSPIWIF